MSVHIEALGRLVAAKRGSRGVRAAAADAGISSATFSRIENGNMPDLETFAKICKWLGKDPRDFLGFEREEAAPPQAIVQFKKDRTVSRDTAIALGELILAAQNAMRARAQLSE